MGKRCVVSQRYWKMKAIHNKKVGVLFWRGVVLYPKDTEKWKQFTTLFDVTNPQSRLCCIPKILKNESNSQRKSLSLSPAESCVVSQRYWKMKAIHNNKIWVLFWRGVVLYPKDTEKWKQFTTNRETLHTDLRLCCIPKILKNESNSQHQSQKWRNNQGCVVSQRYWKMKAIHNQVYYLTAHNTVVLYPKDTEKWKQFTTLQTLFEWCYLLCCIPKILKNESNSQQICASFCIQLCCVVSQRYWKMKAIHNTNRRFRHYHLVVLYPKDTEKWKQFTTFWFNSHCVRQLCCIPKILKNESNSQPDDGI